MTAGRVRERFTGRIAGVGSTSGIRVVVGRWDDGPYAETVEQLSGFYLVTCDDHDALVEAAKVLTRAHPVVEIRPVDAD